MIDEETRKRIREDAEDLCKLAGLRELVDEVAKLLPNIESVHRLAEEAAEAREVPPPRDDTPPEGFSAQDWDFLFKRGRGNPGKSRSRALSLDALHAAWPVIMPILPQWPVFDTEHDDDTKSITTVPMNPSAKLAYLITTWLDPAYTAANCSSVLTLWKARKHRKGVKQKQYPKQKKD